jgi:hypothetical protein
MQLRRLNWNVSNVQKNLCEMENDYPDLLAITADYVQSDEADMVRLEIAVLSSSLLILRSGYDI